MDDKLRPCKHISLEFPSHTIFIVGRLSLRQHQSLRATKLQFRVTAESTCFSGCEYFRLAAAVLGGSGTCGWTVVGRWNDSGSAGNLEPEMPPRPGRPGRATTCHGKAARIPGVQLEESPAAFGIRRPTRTPSRSWPPGTARRTAPQAPSRLAPEGRETRLLWPTISESCPRFRVLPCWLHCTADESEQAAALLPWQL